MIKRILPVLALCLVLAPTLTAQTTTETAASETSATAAETAAPAATATAADPARPETAAGTSGSYELRNQFSTMLREHPPELPTILKLDPTLLSNQQFLNGYPELARFLAAHPEVRRNPHFFLNEFAGPFPPNDLFKEVLEGLFVFSIFIFIALVLSWVVRTLIEQRRWSRLSRTQSEVHSKILDRFGTSAELIEYMKTPSGSKFLESAPIPLQAEQVTQNAPVARMLWSVQVGVVVVAAAIGLLVVSTRFSGSDEQGVFAMGVIAFCVGAGFIASAMISLALSRRLGLWRSPAADAGDADVR